MTSSSTHGLALAPKLPVRLEEGDSKDSDFNTFHLWNQILKELFDIFGWHESVMDMGKQLGSVRGTSIFAGTAASDEIIVSVCVFV